MVRPYVVIQRPPTVPVQDFRAASATKRGYLVAGKRKLDEYAAQVRGRRGREGERERVCLESEARCCSMHALVCVGGAGWVSRAWWRRERVRSRAAGG